MTTTSESSSGLTDEYEAAGLRVFSEGGANGLTELSAIGVLLAGEFAIAELDKRATELRFLQDLRQFRGIYDPEIEAKIGANRSKTFVRATRVKVKTVDSKMDDFLFPANGSRNWGMDTPPIPSIPDEIKQQLVQDLSTALRQQPSQDQIDQAIDDMVKAAAEAMTDTIETQLDECKYRPISKLVVHSGNLYGIGIMKAPLVERKVRMRYVNEGGKWSMKSETYIVPFVDFVPVWRWFPDMAATELENCRYVYERHLMTRQAMLRLAERKSFNKTKIIEYVTSNPDGLIQPRYYDSELRIIGDRRTMNELKSGQYEVLERWGWLDAAQLRECGVNVPDDRIHESFFSNVWLFPNGEIIKAVLQPINGVTWPYHIYYYDKDESSIFAEGIAAVMRDEQTNINAAQRMTYDNAAITAGPQVEINMRLISNKEKAEEIFPFKIWPRTGENPENPALRIINIEGHIQELQGLVEAAHATCDEVTAIPRFAYGDNVTQGAAGTASGMSMLMGNQNMVMKDQFMSYDQGVTASFVKAMYHWNMQFSKNPKIKGDFDVVATGAMALMAKEVRAQQLDQFAAQVANPMDAPFIKRDALLRQRAQAHDLVDVVKTQNEVEQEQNTQAAQQAAQLQQAMQQLQMATAQATLGKLQAEIAGLAASTAEKQAKALSERLAAAYAAMEAAGIALTNPAVAAAGDELLRAAGWVDQGGATPNIPVQGAQNNVQMTLPGQKVGPGPMPTTGGPVPNPNAQGQVPFQHPQVPQAPGPGVGLHKGIETARLTDGQPA